MIQIYLQSILYYKIQNQDPASVLVQMKEAEEEKKILKDKNNNIQYIRGKLLGTGGFAKCFEVINQQNQQIYAAKVIPKKSINQKRQRYKLLVQIKIHRSLKHKHIVQFIQTFEDRQNVYILLQYCQNYTLKDLVKRRKRITEFETKIYIEQIVKALIYIHSHSIIHRDLKLGNILINQSMDTKICDFGLSTRVKHEGEVKKTICGTPNYIAPQILEENGHSYEVDIWSIGVIMYTLLIGKPPFEDNTVEQTYQNIKTNKFSYPSHISLSSQAKDLINKILVTNPLKRIGLQEILSHDFMKYRQQLPKQLPCYTIAIPPFKILEIQSKQLSQHQMNQQSSEGTLSKYRSSFDKNKLGNSAQSQFESKQRPDFIYIRQCFQHDKMVGYLLSNAFIGVYDKKTGKNILLQYGCNNFYIVERKRSKPLKKAFPNSDLQKTLIQKSEQLDKLQNFRNFFITKYGIFKIDEIRKKFLANLQSISASRQLIRQEEQISIFLKKTITLQNGEILTRLTNQIIQLNFNDLTSLVVNEDQNKGIVYFYMSQNGDLQSISYNDCDRKLKAKFRLLNNIISKLKSSQQ